MIVQSTLPSTLTVPSRSYTYVSAPAGLHFDGTLVVTDQKPRSQRQRAYHVSQDLYPSEYGVLVYLLMPSHGEEGEVYQVTIRPSGLHSCTCKAGSVKRHQCLHVAAMSDLVTRGTLPRAV